MADQANKDDQVVELEVDTYQALLDKIEDLEGQIKEATPQKKDGEVDAVDALAAKGKGSQEAAAEQQVNIDDLSRTELLGYIEGELTNNVVNPILVEVNALKLELEIDRAARGKDDFFTYEDEIFELMKENPKMTADRAYKLSKAENPDKGKKSDETDDEVKKKKEREANLRHLPKIPVSERSGVPGSTISNEEPKTLHGAAKKAAEELDI